MNGNGIAAGQPAAASAIPARQADFGVMRVTTASHVGHMA
jgi:hypothetical protein